MYKCLCVCVCVGGGGADKHVNLCVVIHCIKYVVEYLFCMSVCVQFACAKCMCVHESMSVPPPPPPPFITLNETIILQALKVVSHIFKT